MKVVSLFTDDTTPLRAFLPLAPLLPFIQRAERAAAGPYAFDFGRNALSQRIADCVGGKPESFERLLNRIASGRKQMISAKSADELCIALGLHPALVWPREWPQTRDDAKAAS
jgi:hypothetical protein